VLTGGAGYAVGKSEKRDLSSTIRGMLWGMIGSLVLYIYFALGLPGSEWIEQLGSWTAFILTLFGGALGLLFYQLFNRF